MKLITCRDCGFATQRTGPGQLYCPECSELRDMVRKKLWARKNPPSAQQKERNRDHTRRRKELAKDAGAMANLEAKRAITWHPTDGPDLLWQVRIAVPFSYAASKNHIYAMRRTGHVALRRESRTKREEIGRRIRDALKGRPVAHNKVWIDILVQKPNHRGDAVNVVDLVCDALKKAVDVDDRWFCIRRLDWEIAKDDPMLFIGVGQDTDTDCQVCSYCGQIKELSEFNRSKGNRLGVGRECKQCRREGRQLKTGEDRNA